MRLSIFMAALLLAGCTQGEEATNDAEQTSAAGASDATSSTPETTMGPVKVGDCKADSCSVSREVSRETVAVGTDGEIIKLTILGGESDAEGSAMTWNDAPHTVFVFCSVKLPAVALKTDEGWQVDALDFEFLPGVLYASASLYGQACHPEDTKFPATSAVYGYGALPESVGDIEISDPKDLFKIAKAL